MSPRRRLALLCALTVVVVGVAGCGGDDESAEPEPPVGTTTDAGGEGDAANGAQVFVAAGCGSCHTFAAAESSGSVGPNLDDADPSFDLVVDRVTNGQGVMPSFGDQLSAQEIADVAAFVSGS